MPSDGERGFLTQRGGALFRQNLAVSKGALLLLLAEQPRAGVVKRGLSPQLDPSEAAQLHESLLLDAVDRLRRPPEGWAVGVAFAPSLSREYFEHVAPRGASLCAQRGGSELERVAAAFEDAFAEGHGPVAILSPDVPTLPAAFLEALLGRLGGETGLDVTIGLDRSGGFYGLGLRAPAPGLFAELPGRRGCLALELLDRARRLGLRAEKLGMWGEVGTAADAAALAAEMREPAGAALAPRTKLTLERLGFG